MKRSFRCKVELDVVVVFDVDTPDSLVDPQGDWADEKSATMAITKAIAVRQNVQVFGPNIDPAVVIVDNIGMNINEGVEVMA